MNQKSVQCEFRFIGVWREPRDVIHSFRKEGDESGSILADGPSDFEDRATSVANNRATNDVKGCSYDSVFSKGRVVLNLKLRAEYEKKKFGRGGAESTSLPISPYNSTRVRQAASLATSVNIRREQTSRIGVREAT